jgi:predicted transcriptional regulator
MEQLDKDFLSWFAGFWEGEGHFSVKRNGKYFTFGVDNTDERPIRLIKEKLGIGHIVIKKHRKKNPKWSDCYTWRVDALEDVIYVAELLLPHLKFRADEVREKLALAKRKREVLPRRKWSSREVEFLKQNYGKMKVEKLAKMLSRSIESVQCKAELLGLHMGRGIWNKELERLTRFRETWNKKKLERDLKILSCIRNGYKTTPSISNVLEMDPQTIYDRTRTLSRRGLIMISKKNGRLHFDLTPNGVRFLEEHLSCDLEVVV